MEDRLAKKAMGVTFVGEKFERRPKNKWEDSVNKDAVQLLGVRNWKQVEKFGGRKFKEDRARFQLHRPVIRMTVLFVIQQSIHNITR